MKCPNNHETRPTKEPGTANCPWCMKTYKEKEIANIQRKTISSN